MKRLLLFLLFVPLIAACDLLEREIIQRPDQPPTPVVVTATPQPTNTLIPTATPTPYVPPPTAAPPPIVRTFATSVQSVDAVALATRQARVPVTWMIDNRPAGSNLIFEQILTGGELINVELPRSFTWVPSSGSGVVAPYLPGGDAGQIRLRLRLINSANITLTSAEIWLPVYGYNQNYIVSDPSQCGSAPYREPLGFAVGISGSVNFAQEAGLSLNTNPGITGGVVGHLPRNASFTVIGGPYCYYSQSANFRQWRVRAEASGREGWIFEYAGGSYTVTPYRRFVTYDPSQCFRDPFPISAGIEVGEQVEPLIGLSLMTSTYGSNAQVGPYVSAGTRLNVVGGPFCYREEPPVTPREPGLRQWRVSTLDGSAQGWVWEYAASGQPYIQLAAPTTVIKSFIVSPNPAPADGTLTLTWEVENADSVAIRTPNDLFENMGLSGTLTVSVQDTAGTASLFSIHLEAALEDMVFVETRQVNIISGPPPEPEILSFTANPDPVKPGQNLTLGWEFTGASQGTIDRQTAPGQWQMVTIVNQQTGVYTVAAPNTPGQAVYQLMLSDANGRQITQQVTVTVQCEQDTFFVDPQATGCPLNPPATINAAYQQFQYGYMVWDSPNNAILVFYNNGTYTEVFDTWSGEDIVFDQDPPAGLIQPLRGFGKVWVENQAIRDALGWATASEQGYSATFQAMDSGSRYFSLPSARIVRLSPNNTWIAL